MSKLNEYDAEVRSMYLNQKMSDAEVAEALPIAVSAQTVARYRATNGIKGHRRGARSALDQHEQDIRRMYADEGMTDAEIAEALPVEISDAGIQAFRKRKGIATIRNKATGRFSREAQFEKVQGELPAAWERSKRWHSRQNRMVGSAARVGEEFGVGASTANKWLARLGLVESRSAHGEDAPVRALELFDGGLSVPAVAQEMGVVVDTVRNWIESKRDLSTEHYTKRMSPGEHRAWRDSIRIARAPSEVKAGKFNYKGTPMDSTYEVRFARHCDQIGLGWSRHDRTGDGSLVPYDNGDGEGLYGPDFAIGDLSVETKGYYTTKDQAKVHAWRNLRGELALVMHDELADFERTATAAEGQAFLEACSYSDPDPREDAREGL